MTNSLSLLERTFQSDVPTIEMVRHSRVDIARVQFQVDLSIDQTFVVFMIVATNRTASFKSEICVREIAYYRTRFSAGCLGVTGAVAGSRVAWLAWASNFLSADMTDEFVYGWRRRKLWKA